MAGWKIGILLSATVALVGSCKGKSQDAWKTAYPSTAHDEGRWNALPIFTVDNLKKTKAYYRDRLGFQVDWEHNYDTFGIFYRDFTTLYACQRCQGKPGAWAMIFVPDVNAVYAEFKSRGAIIKQPPRDEEWGLREMLVADPDGNTIRFASHIDH